MHRSWVVVVMLGCAGGTKPAQTTVVNTTPADPQSCAHVADHVIDLMSADAKDAPPQAIKQTHDLFLQHCTADQWSVELRRCLGGMSALDQGDRCDALMTDAQKTALGQAMRSGPKPPPPPPTEEPAGSTRSPLPRTGGDPCEGGK